MPGFKDHFSGHAAAYARHRPHYPGALFDWLAEQAPVHDLAWDCATGNGQAALALARHFDRVVASDASSEQIARAEVHPRVTYRVAGAEHSALPDHCIDLVTVAQAAHWFDLPAFYHEVQRVVRPGGVIALWCYGLATISPAVDAVVGDYYEHTIGPWWPPERRHIEHGYRDLPFPFSPLSAPAFTMQTAWSMNQLLDYLGTWSATRRCAAATGHDPLAALAPGLHAAWGDASSRTVHWPLGLRAGTVND